MFISVYMISAYWVSLASHSLPSLTFMFWRGKFWSWASLCHYPSKYHSPPPGSFHKWCIFKGLTLFLGCLSWSRTSFSSFQFNSLQFSSKKNKTCGLYNMIQRWLRQDPASNSLQPFLVLPQIMLLVVSLYNWSFGSVFILPPSYL